MLFAIFSSVTAPFAIFAVSTELLASFTAVTAALAIFPVSTASEAIFAAVTEEELGVLSSERRESVVYTIAFVFAIP